MMLEVLPLAMCHSALRIAVGKGNSAVLEIFERSLKKRLGQLWSLHQALYGQDEASVEYVLKSGVNPNFQDQRVTPFCLIASPSMSYQKSLSWF